RLVDLGDVERQLEGAYPDPTAGAGVGERLLEAGPDLWIRRAKEDERHALAAEPVGHQLRVGVVDKRLGRALLRLEAVGVFSGGTEVALKLRDPLLEQPALSLVDVAAVGD